LLKPSEYRHMEGWGLAKWGRRMAENVRIPSYRKEESKIAQKSVIWYLNVPMC